MTSIYSAGTVSVTAGNAVVTGSGTAWAVALVTGGMFSCAGFSIPIVAIASDTSLTLAYPWPGTTGSGKAYAIARENSDAAAVVDLYDKLTRVLVNLSLAGITPESSGTIADRDALSLAMADKGYIFLHAEFGVAFEFFRWTGTAWDGPFDMRGPGGVGVGGLGLPSPGAAGKFPYYSAPNSITLGDITVAGRNLLDDADASAQLTTLGFSSLGKTLSAVADAAAARTAIGAIAVTDAQPLDVDLTTWSAVSRRAGFDTFVASGTSAHFYALLADKTGSGGSLVFSDDPSLKYLSLAAGTATKAAMKVASGALMTTVAAGAWEYDGVALYFAHVASARGVIPARQLSTVQGSTVGLTNNITTAQSIFATGKSTLTLAANTTYRFRAKLSFNTGTTSRTTSIGFGGSAGVASISYNSLSTSGSAGALNNPQMRRVETAAATALTGSGTGATTDIWIEGVLRTSSAGTLIPQVTFSAGPGGTCETALNSFFEIEPIGADTVVAVGNWS